MFVCRFGVMDLTFGMTSAFTLPLVYNRDLRLLTILTLVSGVGCGQSFDGTTTLSTATGTTQGVGGVSVIGPASVGGNSIYSGSNVTTGAAALVL
jgi:hypothetical protein